MSKVFPLLLAAIIFLFFSHTLNYPWRYFDEDIIFYENLLPIPYTFFELKEIIKSFGTTFYFESSNPIYSNIWNIRGNQFWVLFTLFIFYLLKNNAFNYHFIMLLLHMANTMICFLVISETASAIFKSYTKKEKFITSLIAFLLALCWSLHPVNVESILFASNFGPLVSYFFCFLIIYYFLKKIKHEKFPITYIFLGFLFLIPLFISEHSSTLPLVLIAYSAGYFCFYKNLSLKEAASKAFLFTAPLLISLLVYLVYYVSSLITKYSIRENILLKLERVFWLAPQIFFHYIKLILYPISLSVDHASQVIISKTYFEPYALFSILLFFSTCFISILYLFKRRSALFHFFTLSPFLISMLPYLHIISPVYNLASERYLYLPLFILVLGASHLIFNLTTLYKNKIFILYPVLTLIVICALLSTKTYLRTLDWKDSFSLLKSSVESANNKLYKALRLKILADARERFHEGNTNDNLLIKKEALVHAKDALTYYQNEKLHFQDKTPKILKFYGLDPETLEAKAAFLIAFVSYSINNDPSEAVRTLNPFIDILKPISTHILKFYYEVLFTSKHIDEAETILKEYLNNKISPIALVALSDISEYKYKNLALTEKYLLESFNFFPYDIPTLFGLKRLYQIKGNLERYAHFAYLYGLRTHDKNSLKDSLTAYIKLGENKKANKIIPHLEKMSPDNIGIGG